MEELKTFQELLLSISEEVKNADPKMIMICAGGFITYIVLLVLSIKGKVFCGYENRIKKAKEKGHVIVGKKIEEKKHRSRNKDGERETDYIATYEIEVNGKVRTKRYRNEYGFPATMEFYYVKNPNKLFTELETGRLASKLLLYIIPIAVMYALIQLTGYKG